MQMDLIDRTPGLSNKEMWEYCDRLLAVGSKPPVNQPAIDRIERSRDYYKDLYYKEGGHHFEFRDYQLDIIERGTDLLLKDGFVYLAMEVRTGKTLTALGIADRACAENVLFITKKKGIHSIEGDYAIYKPSFYLQVINYESLHTVCDERKWDLIVCDEAHGMGAMPKPSGRAVDVKELIRKCDPMVVLLSGTPTPESYSQMYHQVYGIPLNPFREFKNFYDFARTHVKIKEKKVNGQYIRDYTNGLPSIMEAMAPHIISYSQRDAGFVSKIKEEVVMIEVDQKTRDMVAKLERDLVINGKEEVILADTAVKLLSKVHQLWSGTIKFESGKSMVIDLSKAQYIFDRWGLDKIAIFYKFKEELNALKSVYGSWLTTDVQEFKSDPHKSIALQIVSGREAISLKEADCIVYYNIDFSATSYWQSRDRMTTKDREESLVYWLFAKGGIESDIYQTVLSKKDYTTSHYKKRNKQ